MPVVWAVAGMSTGGKRTLSMTWMTPLEAWTSASVTLAEPTETSEPLTPNLSLSPFTMVAIMPSVTSPEATSPEKTW